MSNWNSLCVCFLAAAILIPSTISTSNYGSDFYIGTMRNYQGNTNSYKLYLATLSVSPLDYTVKNIDDVTVASGTVSKTAPATVTIPIEYVTNSNTERSEGLHVTATGPISVLVANWQPATIGEYPAYPKQKYPILQYEYYVAAPNTGIVSSAQSEVLLVATEDNTQITITPTVSVVVPVEVQLDGSPQGTLLAGTTKQFSLNRLQTFFFGASGFADLTGTSIVSDKPLTVISGNECANIPSTQAYCEHVEEQIPPTVTWGKQFLIRSYTGKNDDSHYLIVASQPETVVKHNCGGEVTSFMLNLAGDHETRQLYTDLNCYVESDKGILITQMMTGGISSIGDPAVSTLPPIDHYTNEVIFHTPQFDQNLDYNYINIVTQKKDDIIMDGNVLTVTWETINDFNGGIAGYSAKLSTVIAIHDIYSANGQPFHVLVYGYASSNLAGYSFSAGVGIIKQLTKGSLQVRPWYGNILGGVPFIVEGPTFNPDDVISCHFNNISMPCERISDEYAMCVSPRLTFTRRITLRLFTNGEKYTTDSRFYSLSIDDDTRVNILENHRFLSSTQQITLLWDQNKMFPYDAGLDPSTQLVDITLYEVTDDENTIVQMISQVATGLPNTGQAQVAIPEFASIDPINMCAFSVTVRDSPDQQTVISNLQNNVTQWCTNVWIAFVLGDDVQDLLLNQCNKWILSEPLSIRDVLLSRTSSTPCPPTSTRAFTPNSGLVVDTQYYLLDYFHPTAGICFRQRTITGANEGSGNECCYNGAGNLIVGQKNGGSINKVDPRGTDLSFWDTIQGHFKEDVLPYLFCCNRELDPINCKAYYDRRPSDDGSRYNPPVPACVYGDPHIVTLDLHKYTFNGKGEFVLVETPDFEPSFTIHARMVPVKDNNNNDGKATVFSAIIAQQGDSDAVQFELQGTGDEIRLVTYVNGEDVDFSELTSQSFDNVTVTDTGNNTLNAVFSSGAYVTVAETNGLISTLIVYLPDIYRTNTRGLMGNYDNDTSNDLTRKGTTLPLSLNSGLKQIHDWFGMSYIIANKTNGLFTYNNGDSFEKYYDPNFVPIFETTFATAELEQQANELCGDDEFCKFDIAVTGIIEIGIDTKQGSTDFEMLKELSKPIVCDPPCVYGACVDTNVCSCSESYMGTLCDESNATACTFDPCENGATCGAIGGSPVCTCLQGYIGYYCETIDPVNPPITTTSSSVTTFTSTSTSTTSTSNTGTSTTGRTDTSSTTGRETSTDATATSRPERRLGSLSVGAAAGVIIVIVVVVAIVVISIVVIAIVVVSRKKSSAKKYPVESEMVGQEMGKANPAYDEMNEEDDGNNPTYDNVTSDDKKNLVD